MEISGRGNQYLQDNRLDNALLASDPARCHQVVLMAINLIYMLGPLVHPFLPDSSDSISRQLRAPLRSLPEAFSIDILPGHGIGKAEYLFTRIDDKKEAEWRKKYGGDSSDAPPPLSKNAAAKLAKKQAAAAAANMPRTPEVISLEGQIKTQGEKVSAIKKEKVTGASLDTEVAELKRLKVALAALAI
jgi:methionyl-tRNA synthetase